MKKITFCGGGSAGHVIPNIALCEQLRDKYEITYLGTPSIEKEICKKNGVSFYEYDGVKLVRGKILCNLFLPVKLIKSYNQCKLILSEIKPDLLFCKGGYVSLPAAYAAAKLKIPVLTHESDLSAGLANKLIARKCRKVLTTFPSTAKQFKNGVYTGSPMKANLFNRDKISAKESFGLDMRPTILVFGGGSGSQKINLVLRECILNVCKKYNVLHLCGKGNAVQSNVYGYKQVEFCNDMGLAYACADYAVARCGSNSAHELLALKIPTLFIPLENGQSRGDQVENAEYFKNLGLCHVLREADLAAQSLEKCIDELVNDQKLKTALSLTNAACGNRNVIENIVDCIKN